MTFADIAVGQHFTCNGVPYTKKSSRTAWAAPMHPAYNPDHNKWFYFGQSERIDLPK